MTTKLACCAALILCLSATLHHVSGCSCVGNPKFCQSDFAIRGTIRDIQGNYTAYEDLVYSVEVNEVYRNTSDGIVVDETLEIETGGHTCGVELLDNGTTYLISGLYDDDDVIPYSMDRCNSVVRAYNDVDDVSDLGLPCSASLTTITSYIIIVTTLLHFIIQ